jgi:hypothetical protein
MIGNPLQAAPVVRVIECHVHECQQQDYRQQAAEERQHKTLNPDHTTSLVTIILNVSKDRLYSI